MDSLEANIPLFIKIMAVFRLEFSYFDHFRFQKLQKPGMPGRNLVSHTSKSAATSKTRESKGNQKKSLQ